MKNPTFSRSFAYQTIPAYGYVLWKHQKDWNKKIVPQSNLIGLWRKFFSIPIPLNLKQKIGEFAQHYNGATIEAEEIETEQKIKRQMEEYTTKFIRQPHCEITLEKMNFSFDPGNVVALGNSGTVYPTVRITDVWGVLSVEGTGGLINSSWNKVSITLPTKIEDSVITGEGWTLKLDTRYTLTKDEITGHYTVIKK